MIAKAKDPLPHFVEIGPLMYEVARDPRPTADSSGSSLDTIQEMWVSPELAADMSWVVFFHESLHSMFSLLGLGLEKEEEERLCALLSPLILQLVRQL